MVGIGFLLIYVQMKLVLASEALVSQKMLHKYTYICMHLCVCVCQCMPMYIFT